MKNLLLALLFFVSLSISAQTTQEEYNYVTKGLKVQYSSGLDMKKGYSLTLYEKVPYSSCCSAHYYLLKKDEKIAAIVLALGRSIEDANCNFFCIPSYLSDADIWNQFKASLKVFSGGYTYETCFALSKALTNKQ